MEKNHGMDSGHGNCSVRTINTTGVHEELTLRRRWSVRKFASDADFQADRSYETCEIEGNMFLNEGINELFTLLCSASSGTRFNNANAYIGVGDSSTAEAATQTALQASTNKLYKAMDSGYPTYGSNQQAVWRATFTGTEANFAWNELTVSNGNSDSSVNLNRRVSAQGTKASGQTWQVTLTISIS